MVAYFMPHLFNSIQLETGHDPPQPGSASVLAEHDYRRLATFDQ
jgi:hypothetical protein